MNNALGGKELEGPLDIDLGVGDSVFAAQVSGYAT